MHVLCAGVDFLLVVQAMASREVGVNAGSECNIIHSGHASILTLFHNYAPVRISATYELRPCYNGGL